jgi:hypothetical protein
MKQNVQQARFRGANFEGKWSLGVWAENHIVKAINETEKFVVVPYGRSGVGPTKKADKNKYWEEYKSVEQYGKRPDLLVFTKDEFYDLKKRYTFMDDLQLVSDDHLHEIVHKAVLGIESEASIWQAAKMPHFGRDWFKGDGRRKALSEVSSWTAATIIVKDEDLGPLVKWNDHFKRPIYVVHLFYDYGYMVSFDELRRLIKTGVVKAEDQRYDAVSKPIYKVYYGLGIPFGKFDTLAEVKSFAYQSETGKFSSELYFDGGHFSMDQKAIQEWQNL